MAASHSSITQSSAAPQASAANQPPIIIAPRDIKKGLDYYQKADNFARTIMGVDGEIIELEKFYKTLSHQSAETPLNVTQLVALAKIILASPGGELDPAGQVCNFLKKKFGAYIAGCEHLNTQGQLTEINFHFICQQEPKAALVNALLLVESQHKFKALTPASIEALQKKPEHIKAILLFIVKKYHYLRHLGASFINFYCQHFETVHEIIQPQNKQNLQSLLLCGPEFIQFICAHPADSIKILKFLFADDRKNIAYASTFKRIIVKHPQTALAQINLIIDNDAIPAKISLNAPSILYTPSKDEISQFEDELTKALEAKAKPNVETAEQSVNQAVLLHTQSAEFKAAVKRNPDDEDNIESAINKLIYNNEINKKLFNTTAIMSDATLRSVVTLILQYPTLTSEIADSAIRHPAHVNDMIFAIEALSSHTLSGISDALLCDIRNKQTTSESIAQAFKEKSDNYLIWKTYLDEINTVDEESKIYSTENDISPQANKVFESIRNSLQTLSEYQALGLSQEAVNSLDEIEETLQVPTPYQSILLNTQENLLAILKHPANAPKFVHALFFLACFVDDEDRAHPESSDILRTLNQLHHCAEFINHLAPSDIYKEIAQRRRNKCLLDYFSAESYNHIVIPSQDELFVAALDKDKSNTDNARTANCPSNQTLTFPITKYRNPSILLNYEIDFDKLEIHYYRQLIKETDYNRLLEAYRVSANIHNKKVEAQERQRKNAKKIHWNASLLRTPSLQLDLEEARKNLAKEQKNLDIEAAKLKADFARLDAEFNGNTVNPFLTIRLQQYVEKHKYKNARKKAIHKAPYEEKDRHPENFKDKYPEKDICREIFNDLIHHAKYLVYIREKSLLERKITAYETKKNDFEARKILHVEKYATIHAEQKVELDHEAETLRAELNTLNIEHAQISKEEKQLNEDLANLVDPDIQQQAASDITNDDDRVNWFAIVQTELTSEEDKAFTTNYRKLFADLQAFRQLGKKHHQNIKNAITVVPLATQPLMPIVESKNNPFDDDSGSSQEDAPVTGNNLMPQANSPMRLFGHSTHQKSNDPWIQLIEKKEKEEKLLHDIALGIDKTAPKLTKTQNKRVLEIRENLKKQKEKKNADTDFKIDFDNDIPSSQKTTPVNDDPVQSTPSSTSSQDIKDDEVDKTPDKHSDSSSDSAPIVVGSYSPQVPTMRFFDARDASEEKQNADKEKEETMLREIALGKNKTSPKLTKAQNKRVLEMREEIKKQNELDKNGGTSQQRLV